MRRRTVDRDEALDRILAEHAIGRVMQRYGLAVDARDMDAFRACFHADAKLHYGTEFSGTLDEGISWLSQQLPKLRGTMHAFMPSSIELDPASGTAHCDTYAITVTRYPADADGTRPLPGRERRPPGRGQAPVRGAPRRRG